MSLESYRIFNAVIKYQSFISAAEVVNLTPSAVSRSISSLENTLGFQLFIRSRKGVQLTREGEMILPTVQAIISADEQLHQISSEINGLERGTVVLGTFSSVCNNWIPTIVQSFKNLYPQINVHIMQGDYSDVVYWASNGIIDLGFASLPIDADLFSTPLVKDRLFCVTPRTFTPENAEFVTIKDIQSQPFIIQREGYNADTLALIKKYKLSIQPEYFIDDDQSILALIESGLGISIMPEMILKKVSYNINVLPLEPNEFRTIGLIAQPKQLLSPATKKMYEHIIALADRLIK